MRRAREPSRGWAGAAIVLVGIVVLLGPDIGLLELVHAYVHRDASIGDWLADALGVAAGVVIATVVLNPSCRTRHRAASP